MESITRKAQIVVATAKPLRQNKFLLLKTNQERGGFWQNCTGKIEDAEDFLTGAIREVQEETGLENNNILEVIDLGLEHHFLDRWKRNVHEKAYLILVNKPWDVIIDHHEHQDFKWVDHNDLNPDCVKYIGNYEALKIASERLKG
ncbi:MAG TPA: NUDIX domain-containing protein [Bacteriovoracaceae bacterium]|nr:NUDIX domain-containing protein [Bacteriovoracaceae bacterium]